MKYQFDELELIAQKRYKRKAGRTKENTGLDTETYHGKAYLICDDSGRYKILHSFDDALVFLTHFRFRNANNWFFNIKFDFEAIIKWLPLHLLQILYATGELDYQAYHLKFLDKKFLRITNNKHNYTFYDINNFIGSSLNQASKNYLNETKYDAIDSSRLNTDKDYWKENIEEIIFYCKKDANLTKRVADYFWGLIDNHIHFLPSMPFSKGAYSQEYFLNKCYIPTIDTIPDEVLRFAYNSYSGGRFELLKRGHFDNVYLYDIKSAYPYQMAQLPDYTRGEWIHTNEFQEEAISGFYKCQVSHLDAKVSPFMVKEANLNVYPNGYFEQYLTQKEIEDIDKLFPETEIEIEEGYYFEENEILYPLQEEILRLYKWKETEKDPDIKYCIKIILNSLYGKFIQTVGGRTGRIFNPIWASEITANTRLMLLMNSVPCIDDIIGYSTDSIHSTVPIHFENNLFHNTNLGTFEEDATGEGVYIQSDVYSIDTGKKVKTRYRGFSLEKMSTLEEFKKRQNIPMNHEVSLFNILSDILGEDTFTFSTTRPLHLGEVLAHTKTKTIEDLNIWNDVEKNIQINGDTKRVWERSFQNGYDALHHSIDSSPIFID